MPEPQRLGLVVDMREWAERFRGVTRTREEIAAWEAEGLKAQQLTETIGRRAILASVHDADAVEQAGPITPDDLSREGIEWARRWTPEQPGAIVWGRKGSGKTTLLARLLRRLDLPDARCPDAAGRGVCLASLPRLISQVRLESRRGTSKPLLDALGRVEVLVLDDLGRGLLQRGEAQYLWEILDARWSHGRLPLLVTSNFDPEIDWFCGVRSDREERNDVSVALDRLHALAPQHICYDSPKSRRKT